MELVFFIFQKLLQKYHKPKAEIRNQAKSNVRRISKEQNSG